MSLERIEDMDQIIKMLLNNACPSIRYRVRKEILGENINSEEMIELQTAILEDEKVQSIISKQFSSG